MKKLPIGKQHLTKLINEDCVYVDKTEIIYRLISTGSVYFLSRPRRFGKSLTISTLAEIFTGNKELFKGLWIYDKIEWKTYPIIYIDFSKIGIKEIGTEKAIVSALNTVAGLYGISLKNKTPGLMFDELIEKTAKKGQVVILIDEYDKPIIDYIDDIPQAEKNREILKNFYSVLKGNDKFIKLLFITGVSKFSKVSVFSDLNHLDDITMDENYNELTGYTEHEIERYFSDYIETASQKFRFQPSALMNEIRNWYDGYSWNGNTFVYNPYSLLNFFSKQKFEDHWFKSGTPTFLTKLIKKRNFDISRLEGITVTSDVFDKYELSNLETIALLFQTGYLTVKSYDMYTGEYLLSYPNREVRLSFERMLLETLSERTMGENAILLKDLTVALKENNIDRFIHLLKVVFKSITYPLIEKKENYYHSVFYLTIMLLGFDTETEVMTCDGRIDCVIKTGNYIYIVEFKLGTAQEAIDQISRKQYALKYTGENKKIILIGIGFDVAQKNIGEYLVK